MSNLVLQTEASECGLAVLAMIVSAHGHSHDLASLRRLFPVSPKGATLHQLIRNAAELGFSSRPSCLEIEELGQLKLPCILHWDLNQFVVLAAVGRRHVTILDPAVGERRLSMREASRHFTGVALELSPNADFQPQAAAPRVALAALRQGARPEALDGAGPRRGAGAAVDAFVAQLLRLNRTAGFIQPGQTVWLRDAAYPHQKFGMARGSVAEVSDSPLTAQDLPAGQAQALQAAAQTAEPLRRITVRLAEQHVQAYGQQFPLKAGQALEADVLQESRKVWEWIFEPLLAARQRAGKFLSASPNNTSPGG